MATPPKDDFELFTPSPQPGGQPAAGRKRKAPPRAIDVPTDPRTIRRRLAFFDTGMKFGFAVLHPDGSIDSGTWRLDRGGQHDSIGMRMIRLQAHLDELHKLTPLDLVGFESVNSHKGVFAAHSYGSQVGKLMEFCESHKIPHTGIKVGAIKQAATGKGNAKKPVMMAAAKKRWPHIEIEDDNHADALWGLVCLAEEAGVPVF